MTLDDKSLQKVLNKQQKQLFNTQLNKGAYKMVKKRLEILDKADDCQSLTITETAQAALAMILLGIMGITALGMSLSIQSATGLLSVAVTTAVTGLIVSDRLQGIVLNGLVNDPEV